MRPDPFYCNLDHIPKDENWTVDMENLMRIIQFLFLIFPQN